VTKIEAVVATLAVAAAIAVSVLLPYDAYAKQPRTVLRRG